MRRTLKVWLTLLAWFLVTWSAATSRLAGLESHMTGALTWDSTFWPERPSVPCPSQLEDLVLLLPQVPGESGDGERHGGVHGQLLTSGG